MIYVLSFRNAIGLWLRRTLVLLVYYSAKMAIEGAAKKISFWGSFYEAEAMVKDVKIVVRMMRNDREIGEEVCIVSESKFQLTKFLIMNTQKKLWGIFSISMQSQNHFVNKYQNEVERFVFCGLEKLYKISLAFLRLHPQVNDTPEIEFSLGILARSILMDMILVMEIKNTYTEYKNEPVDALREKVKECCLKLINDGTTHFVEEIYSSEILTDEEKKAKSRIFTSFFPNTFDESGDKPRLKNEFKFRLAGIVKDAKDSDLVFSSPIFNLYSYYSKYDHLSHWTSLSSHLPFEEKKGKLDLSIILMTAHLRDLILIAIDYDDIYKNLQSYVDELEILLNEPVNENQLKDA